MTAKSDVAEPCFLCNANARWQESEGGRRRHYLCSSPSCGEYEISLGAMERLKFDIEFRKRASAKASRIKNPGLILEIRIHPGPTRTVSATAVKRRPSLGGTA